MQKLNLGVNIGDTNISDLKDCAAKAVAEISERAGKAGQFLNWIDVLPKNQIATLQERQEKHESIGIECRQQLAEIHAF